MNRIIAVAGFLSIFAMPQAHAADRNAAPDPSLAEAERGRLVELFEQSQVETNALVAQAQGDRWTTKPAEDRWSVAEVLEHLALAEEGIFALARGALDAEPDPEWEASAATGIDDLLAMLQDRSQKFQAPEGFQPKGEMSRADLLARYAAARAKTLAFVQKTDAPLKKHTATGPPGKMNVHQWLALIAAHNLRHNQQIQEVLDSLGD